MAVFFVLTAVRTSNPTKLFFFESSLDYYFNTVLTRYLETLSPTETVSIEIVREDEHRW
jgi:hypothetical protein